MEQDIYMEMVQAMPADQIDHWQSDLYVKVTDVSKEIVERYHFKNSVTTFVDQIDHELWFNIPFAYTPFWKELN